MKKCTEELAFLSGKWINEKEKQFILEVFFKGNVYEIEGNYEKLRRSVVRGEDISLSDKSKLFHLLEVWDADGFIYRCR